MWTLAALGGQRERITQHRAETCAAGTDAGPVVVALQAEGTSGLPRVRKTSSISERRTPWRMSAAISRKTSRAEGIERSRIQWPSQNPSTVRGPEITSRGSTVSGSPDNVP